MWLDDVRRPPKQEGWCWVKSVEEALDFARQNVCEEWALDHDLGTDAPTGTKFVIDLAKEENFHIKLPPIISIHSTNSIGVGEMVRLLHYLAKVTSQNVEIVVRPLAGVIMDRTPHYERPPK